MAVRRKQEEKNLQLLRELAAQPHNKQCLDCGQRGPTYVNMTIGSFVCTSCSGRLRGLTPPHRVKSISMASFSAEEIEFIKQRGNEWCRAVWLGLYDPSRHPEMDSKDDTQIKDFMAVKYEKKRYYVDPSVAFKDRPPGGSQPSPPAASAPPSADPLPAVKPLSKLAGGPVKPITLNQNSPTSKGATRPTEKKNIDLLADLSPVTSAAQADPFSPTAGRPAAAPAPAPAAATAANANFANFANFDALSAATPQMRSGSTGDAASAAFANFNSPAAALSAVPLSTATAPAAAAGSSAADRYAALKELDEVLKAEVDPKIDWGSPGNRDPASSSQGWASFATPPVLNSNGTSAYGTNGTSPYGTNRVTSPYGTNGTSPYGANGTSPYGTNGSAPYGPSPPQSQQQQQQGMAAFPAQFPAQPQLANGYTPDMAGFGSSGLMPGQWPAASQQTTAWSSAPAPPAANPFMSCNGGSPANPHNPFL